MYRQLKCQREYDISQGQLEIPKNPSALVILCLGGADSRFSPRIHFIIQHLQRRGFSTFIFDMPFRKDNLLYPPEQTQYLVRTTQTLMKLSATRNLPVAYFSTGYGTAIALSAAAVLQCKVKAIVSCNGNPQTDTDYLSLISTPVLLIASQLNLQMVASCRVVLHQLSGSENLAAIILGANDLFYEEKAVQRVAILAGDWFSKYVLAKKLHKPSKCMVA